MSPEEGIAFVAERMLQYEVNMTDLFEDPADGMVFISRLRRLLSPLTRP